MNDPIEKVNTIMAVVLRGVAGAATIEAVPDIAPDKIASIGQLLIQLVIGVVTLIGILKKSKQPSINVQKAPSEDESAQ